MLTKLDKLEKLYGHESMDFDFIRYLPGLGKVFYQGQIAGAQAKRKRADPNYTDKNTLQFNVVLTANPYTNFNRMHICLPIKVKSKTNNNNDIESGLITINFFHHWLKEAETKRYGDNTTYLFYQ